MLKGDALIQYVNQARAEGRSLSDVAAALGYGYKQLDNALYLARKSLAVRERAGAAAWNPLPFQVDLGEPWQLTGDWCIVGDVHAPLTDYEFAQMPAAFARRYLKAPRKLLIAGDFFDMGNFSSYAAVVATPAWKQEREAARQLLREWRETFDEIRLILGNHDRRLQKWMNGQFDDEDMLSLLQADGARMSNYGYCYIDEPAANNVGWLVAHPKEYSINQLTVGEQLAMSYQRNVISFHEHHAALGWDRYKNYLVVNGGTLADGDKMAYKRLDVSKKANYAKAFVILRDGYPYLYGEGITDWQKWI